MDVKTGHGNSEQSVKRSEELWIPDGNIVLVTDSHLFKVHKSVLSMQSTVFNDMFELTAIDGGKSNSEGDGTIQEAYEGLPLIRLVGDDDKDVCHLLHAVYERQYYRVDNDDTPLEVVTALLMLSTKYDFKHIRRDVIAHISRQYPMTLAAHDSTSSATVFGEKNPLASFVLLKALHKANVDVLLPAVYHACAVYFPHVVVKYSSDLDPECSRILILGKFRLERGINELIAMVPGYFLEKSGAYSCQNEKNGIRVSNLDGCINTYRLKFIEGGCVVKKVFEELCGTCRVKMAKLINDERQEIWASIPGYFGFPKWDTLQAKLEEIVSGRIKD